MKIYFAGSIRGGREMVEMYEKILKEISVYGTVLTEHIADKKLSAHGEVVRGDKDIYERDVAWIDEADVILAEVTRPSLGVGYEIGYAEAKGKRIICLYQEGEGRRLSAMLAGNSSVSIIPYKDIDDLVPQLAKLFV